MASRGLIPCVIVLVGLCGCAAWPAAPAARRTPNQIIPVDTPGQAVDAADYYLVIQVRLGIVELPAGTVSNSEDIWSYTDEEAIVANRSAGLGRNGLRAGIATAGAWPDVERILKDMAGRQISYRLIAALPGEPVQVVLKQCDEEQHIFTFHADRTLSGSVYPPGDDLLTLSCSINQDDPTVVHMAAVPQIRASASHAGVVTNPTGPALAPVKGLHSFEDLRLGASVPVKGMLVVGPGERSADSYSLGHHFLTTVREGVRYETVLVMIPEVFAAPRRPL